MNRLLLFSMTLLFVGCGIFKRKHLTKPTQKLTKETEIPKKADKEEAYYGEYFPVNRVNMPYKERVESYVDEFSGIAMVEMARYGIPASITLAQGILESGAGTGTLAQRSNNHFGIKCHTGWDGGKVKHDDDKKGECFRTYKHPNESYEDHSSFLKNRKRYNSLFSLRKDNYKAWAKGLKVAGYATDPNYANKLIRLIQTYNLDKYDNIVLNKGGVKAANRRVVEQQNTIAVEQTKESRKPKSGKKMHTVKKGDTLYSLSKKYDISIKTLRQLNDIRGNNISIGQELIVK